MTTGFFQAARCSSRLFNRSVRELMATSHDIILDVIDENIYGEELRSAYIFFS